MLHDQFPRPRAKNPLFLAAVGHSSLCPRRRRAAVLRHLAGAAQQFRDRARGLYRRRDRHSAVPARGAGLSGVHHDLRAADLARTDLRSCLACPARAGDGDHRAVSERDRPLLHHRLDVHRLSLFPDAADLAVAAMGQPGQGAGSAGADHRGRRVRVARHLWADLSHQDAAASRLCLGLHRGRRGDRGGGPVRLARLSAHRRRLRAIQASGAAKALLALLRADLHVRVRGGRSSSCSPPS